MKGTGARPYGARAHTVRPYGGRFRGARCAPLPNPGGRFRGAHCAPLPLHQLQQLPLPFPGLSGVGMLPEGEVEAGPADEHGGGVGEFPEAPFAVVGAHAGVAGAVEGHALHHHVQADLVDAAAAVLLGGHDPLRPLDVLGEEVQARPCSRSAMVSSRASTSASRKGTTGSSGLKSSCCTISSSMPTG